MRGVLGLVVSVALGVSACASETLDTSKARVESEDASSTGASDGSGGRRGDASGSGGTSSGGTVIDASYDASDPVHADAAVADGGSSRSCYVHAGLVSCQLCITTYCCDEGAACARDPLCAGSFEKRGEVACVLACMQYGGEDAGHWMSLETCVSACAYDAGPLSSASNDLLACIARAADGGPACRDLCMAPF